MAAKDLFPILISLLALGLSVLGVATDTRGLAVIVRGADLDPELRTYSLHVSMINTGTQDIMFFAPDVSATEKPEDAECPLEDITPGIHAPRLDDSIAVDAGAIVNHTFEFALQNMRQGTWAICIDGIVADFVGNSDEVRFKSGAFRAIQEDGVWEVVSDRLNTDPKTLVERELKLRSFPTLF
ncbi:MAG: hypothetical protein AAFY31_11405 [Pseudomonadota bacterium]